MVMQQCHIHAYSGTASYVNDGKGKKGKAVTVTDC
jgi:hypothetical protein